MTKRITFVGNAPRESTRAAWSVCAYDNCNAAPDKELGAPLCMSHAKRITVQVMLLTNTTVDQTTKNVAGKRNAKTLTAPYAPSKGTLGLVYFIQFGDRIKIGFTTSLDRRMRALPHDEILALVPGTMTDERRCHKKFAALRITGEWFSAGPELLDFIKTLPVHESLAA